MHGGAFTVYDHTDTEVATITPSIETIRGARTTCYVLSVDPGLRGELRRLVVAAPIVLAGIGQRN